MRAIRKHLRDAIAIVVLFSLAMGVGYYILQNQRLRIPILEEKPFELKMEFETAQAVTPGQGQTVRVSGIRVGDISDVELKGGRGIITVGLDRSYDNLVREDATAFLRPKTGLKDMFIELRPGSRSEPLMKEKATVPIYNTLPDVNPDEFLSSLDADTRDYLKLLLNGAGRGLKGRSDDLRDVLRRFEPTYRDLARVSEAGVERRQELRRLINSLNRLNAHLATKDEDLAQLVDASSATFRAFASERENVSATVRELPSALRQTSESLSKVERMAVLLGPTVTRLRPSVRALNTANRALDPFQREATPLLRDDIRPFVREARLLVRNLKPAARDLVRAEPTLTRTFGSLNHLFNLLGFNPNGREAPGSATRQEGNLFWLSWLSHQSANLFTNADAHGPMRPVTLGGTCATIRGTAQSEPQL